MNINQAEDEKYSLLSSRDEKKADDTVTLSQRVMIFCVSLFPIFSWLPKYKLSYIRGDIIAGLTVGITLIPQGMAYALVAGLPPIYGLYSAVVPALVYVVMGTSPHLSVGPFAVISLLTREAVLAEMKKGHLDPNDTAKYVSIAITLCFMVGVLQFLFGVLRLGFVSNFLSDPVRNGFNSASAITIILSQLPSIFGLKVKAESFQLAVIAEVIEHIKETNIYSVIICTTGMILLLSFKRIEQRFKRFPIPGPLIVMALAAGVSYGFDLQHRVKLPVVGPVPSGLPRLSYPDLSNVKILVGLLPSTVVIGVVAYMSNIAIASKFAESFGYTISATQELIAFGFAQVAGSFFSSFPISASLSRTAINTTAGAKTHLSGLVNAGLIMLTLLFLTKVVQPLPKAALAAVVLIACYPLIEVRAVFTLWREKKRDLFVMIITFLTTLLVGILPGLLLGMALSILALAYNSAYPEMEILTNIPNTTTYKPLRVQKGVASHTLPSVLAVYVATTSLNFTNMSTIKSKLEEMVNNYDQQSDAPVRVIILDCSSVYDIDSSALRSLKDLLQFFAKRKIAICFANVTTEVYNTLSEGKIFGDNLLREDFIYQNMHEAVVDCHARFVLDGKSDSKHASINILKVV